MKVLVLSRTQFHVERIGHQLSLNRSRRIYNGSFARLDAEVHDKQLTYITCLIGCHFGFKQSGRKLNNL
jgi:hypothetical protein